MIKMAAVQEAPEAVKLAGALWPEQDAQELIGEMEGVIASSNSAVMLAYQGSEAVGFAQCQLRFDYVEGTGSSPAGYLEGLYVAEGFRKQGIAGKLVQACEDWSREKGCREFASDCELDNEESLAMHLKLGFAEANRIICFHKPL